MKYWVGITDHDWFNQLARLQPDEVNFWQPSARPPRLMDPGTLFLFKLHAPNHVVVGGGYFVRFTVLPCFLAWEAFGDKNGVKTLQELVRRMTYYRHSSQHRGSEIGCNILVEPFFFSEEEWIPVPENWKPNIQRGLTYDTDDQYGLELWEAVQSRLVTKQITRIEDQDSPLYGSDYLTRARLGQGSFRVLVTDSYHRRCAVTNEKTLPALEAAHIKSYRQNGPHRINNGLLLRADVHRLFDDGYVTLDEKLRFVVSQRVREQFENGREYYRYHGARLQNLPDLNIDQPSIEFVKWHNESRFERL